MALCWIATFICKVSFVPLLCSILRKERKNSKLHQDTGANNFLRMNIYASELYCHYACCSGKASIQN